MRRLALAPLILALLLLSGFSASSRSFVWQRVATDVQVRADGSLGVTETLTLRYTGGPFTFAFRDLANRRLDSIGNISVGDGERVFQQVDDDESKQPYSFSVSQEGDAQRVRWVYPETTGGERTFVLRYDVAGAIRRYDSADELWWSVAFPDREELVEQASGRITFPSAVPAEQLDASTPDLPGTLARAPGEVSVQGANIAPKQELTLRVRFPKQVVAGGEPAWQARDAAQEAYDRTTRPTVNIALSAVAAGLLVLFGVLITFWWRRNRDPQPAGPQVIEPGAPPEYLAPASAAKLLGQSAGTALLSTLLDLANRGYLTLRESKSGWRDLTTKVTAVRTGAPTSGLVPFETATLAAIGLSAENSVIVLNDERSAITKALAGLDPLYREVLVERGYLDEAGRARRRSGLVIGSLLLILGGLAFIPAAILASRYSYWLPAVAGVIALAGLLWLCLGAAVRGVTEAGAEALARWRAFGSYLKHVRPEQAQDGQFASLLPYAVAFGNPKRLTRVYSQIGEPLPAWFYPVIIGHAGHGGAPAAGGQGGLLLQDFGQNFITAINGAGASVGASGGGAAGGGGASGGGGGGAG